MGYKRFISYLYQYDCGEKGRNAGFVKTELENGQVRFHIVLMGDSLKEADLYLVDGSKEQHLKGVFVHHMQLQADQTQFVTQMDNLFASGLAFSKCAGIVLWGNSQSFVGTMWMDLPVSLAKIEIENYEESKKREEKKIELKREGKRPKEIPLIKTVEEIEAEHAMKAQSKSANGVLELLKTAPKLPLFENDQVKDCVRIEPDDIGKMPMENWRLGLNSFLTHGYYQYRYLMLGRMVFQDQVEQIVLGVPGVYSSQEKYLAALFGFEEFIPTKRVTQKTGNFGYWIAMIAV